MLGSRNILLYNHGHLSRLIVKCLQPGFSERHLDSCRPGLSEVLSTKHHEPLLDAHSLSTAKFVANLLLFFLVRVQVLSSPKTVFSAESVVFSTSVFHLAGPKLGSHLFPFALPSPRNRVEAASLQEGQHQFLC